MTNYSQGDVVLIPFPFTDFSTMKQRPAVVISSNEFNASHQDVIAAAVTSHIPEQVAAGDYVLAASDLRSAGLPKPSLIKPGKIVTIDQRLIRKKLGVLPASTLANIIAHIQQIIGHRP